MYLIEQMLTGQMKMSDFIILLKSDKSLQEIIRGFVPQEAIGNRSHAFWKEMSYDAILERNFNFLRLVTDLARFDGTIRDNLNIFYNIRCAYLYYKPDLCCTNKYFDAHDRYLAAVGEYYEGPEVTQTLNKIVEDALFITPKNSALQTVLGKQCGRPLSLRRHDPCQVCGSGRDFAQSQPEASDPPKKDLFCGKFSIPEKEPFVKHGKTCYNRLRITDFSGMEANHV